MVAKVAKKNWAENVSGAGKSLGVCLVCSGCTGDGVSEISATFQCPGLCGLDGSRRGVYPWGDSGNYKSQGALPRAALCGRVGTVRGPMAAGNSSDPCVSAASVQKRRTELCTGLGTACCPGLLQTPVWALTWRCIPQPPCRLEKARWTSADGCDPELQPGGPGGLLQLAGMRWASDGKSLSLPASLCTVWTCSCVCREFAVASLGAGIFEVAWERSLLPLVGSPLQSSILSPVYRHYEPGVRLRLKVPCRTGLWRELK